MLTLNTFDTLKLAVGVEIKLYFWSFVCLAEKHSDVSSYLFFLNFFVAQSFLFIIMAWKYCEVKILFELLKLSFLGCWAIIKLLSFLISL